MEQEVSLEDKATPRPSLFSPDSPSYKWWVMMALLGGVLTNSLIMGTVNIALPSMMTNLRADVETIQWVVTIFMITRTVVMPLVGWLGAILGNRTLYVASLALYVIASALCSIAWSVESLIFFRFLQGLGAGPVFPLSMAILYETFPQEQRGLSMGVLMFGLSFGPAIGPSLGGYLIEHLNWRAIFYINIPVGIGGLLLAGMILPKISKVKKVSLDAFGLISLTLFLVPLLVALSQGRREGWDSNYILTMFAMALVSFVVFLGVELRHAAPLIDLSVFGNLSFCMVCVVTLVNSMIEFGQNFLIALFVQRALLYTPALAGLILLPGAIVWGATSLFSGQMSDKVNPRAIIMLGIFFASLVSYEFAHIDTWTSTGFLVVLLMLRSFTRGCVMSPLMTAFVSNLPNEKVRMGTGLRGLINGLGGTFGVAACGALLERRQTIHAIAYGEDQLLYPLGTNEASSRLQAFLMESGETGEALRLKTAMTLRNQLMQEASLTAYHDCFLIVSVISFATLIPSLLIRRSLPLPKSLTPKASSDKEEETKK